MRVRVSAPPPCWRASPRRSVLYARGSSRPPLGASAWHARTKVRARGPRRVAGGPRTGEDERESAAHVPEEVHGRVDRHDIGHGLKRHRGAGTARELTRAPRRRARRAGAARAAQETEERRAAEPAPARPCLSLARTTLSPCRCKRNRYRRVAGRGQDAPHGGEGARRGRWWRRWMRATPLPQPLPCSLAFWHSAFVTRGKG